MGVLVGEAIGGGEAFELEAGLALVVIHPVDPFGTQGVAGPHQIQQIPAGVALLPAISVWVHQVAVQGVAGYLVVEAQVVVAQDAGLRHREFPVNGLDEGGLAHPKLVHLLRRDAGDETGLGLGQVIWCQLAVDHQGLADDVELGIGADAGKLRRSIATRMNTKGFVVVEVEAGLGVAVLHCCLSSRFMRQVAVAYGLFSPASFAAVFRCLAVY